MGCEHCQDNEPDKFLSVEIIICYMDHTWDTDYVYIPFPDSDTMESQDQEILTECIKRWEEQEEAVVDQRGSIGPIVAHYGLYNVNWDEPVDKDGNGWEETVPE